ncbi:hypothetical protein EVAR_35952_1 [Eumeta japonica]|uniref:Uncharacterized protein n=1 Tax=Eumeta variegata TaxID=151549 RepID=A0A4C1W697_EUMVA|nr:hypothetical protein EVAR_35952_1 [Eumeta japonica]
MNERGAVAEEAAGGSRSSVTKSRSVFSASLSNDVQVPLKTKLSSTFMLSTRNPTNFAMSVRPSVHPSVRDLAQRLFTKKL